MILSEHIAIQRELLPAKDMDKDAQSLHFDGPSANLTEVG
jgi:hypothetical protein